MLITEENHNITVSIGAIEACDLLAQINVQIAFSSHPVNKDSVLQFFIDFLSLALHDNNPFV